MRLVEIQLAMFVTTIYRVVVKNLLTGFLGKVKLVKIKSNQINMAFHVYKAVYHNLIMVYIAILLV